MIDNEVIDELLSEEELAQEDIEMGCPSWDEIREQEEIERKEEMKKMKPDVLIEVHVNEEGKVEDSRVISVFHTGEAKYGWEEEFDTFMLEYHGFLGCDEVKPNTLYHAYVKVHSYRCSYEYDEWDTEHYYLQVIPVIENYSQHLADEEEYEEQKQLEKGNRQLPGIVSSKEFKGREEGEEEDEYDSWHSSVSTHLTYNDLRRMVQKLAEVDIYLAHRIYSGWSATQMLGEHFSQRIADVEKKRREFRGYLTSNYNRDKDQKVKLTEDGYKLPKTYRYEAFTITHEEVDNIPDEWLMEMRQEEILKQMFEAKKVAQKLLQAKGSNKRYINVVNG